MENRDKFLILIVVAWIGAAVFFKSTTDNMFLRMDQLVELQTKHVDNVNKEFRDDLKTLNLQFIGRGKHLRQAQKDIITNVNRIISVTDSLGQSIANLKLDLENFSRDTDQNFSIRQNVCLIFYSIRIFYKMQSFLFYKLKKLEVYFLL